MKTIKIKSLKLTNFKGIRKLELNNLSLQTFIYGDNGVGKTSIFDSVLWLLFGKDSTDRKVFEIQPLDAFNNMIPKIDVEVSAVLDVNGERVELTRIMRQKWVKQRGALEAVYTGNETVYEWNGVPMSAGEYMSKINTIVDEKVFKLITNPAAFNALKWQDQRDVLIDMTGTISDEDVASGNIEFEALLSKLVGKSLEEYSKQIKASITKSKNEIKNIPTRIDEVERGKPEALDFEDLRNRLAEKGKEIESVNEQISDKLKAQQADFEAQKAIQNDIFSIDREVGEKTHELQRLASDKYNELLAKPREIQNKIDGLDREIQNNEQTVNIRKQKISGYDHQLTMVMNKMAALREKWNAENSLKFEMSDDECACPTCKRTFDMAVIEEKRSDLEAHFISGKRANLKRIEDEGKAHNNEKIALEAQINSLHDDNISTENATTELWKQRAELTEALKALGTNKSSSEIYAELLKENEAFFNAKNQAKDKLKQSLENRPTVDNSELKQRLHTLNIEVDSIKFDLQKEVAIKSANERIAELEKEESTLAQAIADMEKEQYVIDAFEKEKSNRIEASVNKRFRLVQFKLFETQINGGEVPTCKALINGVPFSDANTASKINAGLDIINTLCTHYEATAPIFIDNRESVVDLIPTESQVINLIVSESDKTLRVEDKPLDSTSNALKKVFESAEQL